MLATPLTDVFGIKHPIVLAGMGAVSDGELAAAVTNAGGLGCMGGATMSVKSLRMNIDMLKENLVDKNGPFGVDLLIPQLGGNARKTNKDYTGGHLPELIDLIIEGGAKLFVCAVGVPPVWVVEKLHAAGILVMNMVGHVKHVQKALNTGVDLICAQGGEGGGHTGDIATSILIPKVVDACRGKVSPLTGGPVHVLAAGGIFDGRGLAMALSMGAVGVWVGTRFVACEEAGAGPYHKRLLQKTDYTDTIRISRRQDHQLGVFPSCSMRSTRIACLAALFLVSAVVDKSWTFLRSANTKLRSKITEDEVLAAQKGWGDALVSISTTYEAQGFAAAKALAEEIIDSAYGYNYGPVLFKPTLAGGAQTFRTTREGALAYFVGGDPAFPDDTGFALKGWRKVEIVNSAIFREGNIAVTTGNVLITDKTGAVTKVDKTWAFFKGRDRKLRIVAHHSSLPYEA